MSALDYLSPQEKKKAQQEHKPTGLAEPTPEQRAALRKAKSAEVLKNIGKGLDIAGDVAGKVAGILDPAAPAPAPAAPAPAPAAPAPTDNTGLIIGGIVLLGVLMGGKKKGAT